MILRAFLPFAPSDVAYPGLQPWYEATVPGILLDDGGFPAVAHGMDGLVRGWVHAFTTEPHDELLGMLDRHHQVGASPHVRTLCMATAPGIERPEPCHGWLWTGALDLPVVVGGDWSRHSPTLPLAP